MSLKDPNVVNGRSPKRVAIVISNPAISTTTGWPVVSGGVSWRTHISTSTTRGTPSKSSALTVGNASLMP
jgi:hypothetical protein